MTDLLRRRLSFGLAIIVTAVLWLVVNGTELNLWRVLLAAGVLGLTALIFDRVFRFGHED